LPAVGYSHPASQPITEPFKRRLENYPASQFPDLSQLDKKTQNIHLITYRIDTLQVCAGLRNACTHI
jgi:hypothetical protein